MINWLSLLESDSHILTISNLGCLKYIYKPTCSIKKKIDSGDMTFAPVYTKRAWMFSSYPESKWLINHCKLSAKLEGVPCIVFEFAVTQSEL